ncbi:MAG: hypothetical protein ABI132_02465 [Rhodanobacteraceae bacterium]
MNSLALLILPRDVQEAVRTLERNDAEIAELQLMLAEPEAGDVIPGSGGCRKLRWRVQGRGKRGGYLL